MAAIFAALILGFILVVTAQLERTEDLYRPLLVRVTAGGDLLNEAVLSGERRVGWGTERGSAGALRAGGMRRSPRGRRFHVQGRASDLSTLAQPGLAQGFDQHRRQDAENQ